MNLDSEKQVRAVINVTPMIDVLLVLLIVFMAIAPRQSDGLDALVPQESVAGTSAAPENPVVLEIAANGAYRLNSELVGVGELGARLSQMYAKRGSKVLFLKGARELEFGAVATAIDTARGVDVLQIALMPR